MRCLLPSYKFLITDCGRLPPSEAISFVCCCWEQKRFCFERVVPPISVMKYESTCIFWDQTHSTVWSTPPPPGAPGFRSNNCVCSLSAHFLEESRLFCVFPAEGRRWSFTFTDRSHPHGEEGFSSSSCMWSLPWGIDWLMIHTGEGIWRKTLFLFQFSI